MICPKILISGQTAFLFLLFSLTLLFDPLSISAQAPNPDESSPFDPRFGLVNSFVNTAEANAAGAGWTRVFFRWDVIQPAGPFDWKPSNVPDTLLDAELEAGREVVAVLIGTPPWATEQAVSTAVPPSALWGDFVFKIATQYKGRIKHWVIWNQPDIDDPNSPNFTWAGSEEAYYNLLREAYLKIKAVDPEMQVHLAGLTYTWDRDRGKPQYLARLLDIILTDPQAPNENFYFDAVSYHSYYDPRQILDIGAEARRILEERGLGNKPIWLNETNAPPSDDYLEPGQVSAGFNVSLEEQSAFVIQAFALGLAAGMDRIAFNQMRNEPEAVVLDGLLRADNSRRPAFAAFRTVTTYFAAVQDARWQQFGNVFVVTLDRDGQTTTVLWNLSSSPTVFTLNAIAPQAVLLDEQGNQQAVTPANGVFNIELPGAICSSGGGCVIGGAPRLVVEVGSPSQRPELSALADQDPTASVAEATPEPTSSPTPLAETPTAASDAPAAPPPTLTPTPSATFASVPPTSVAGSNDGPVGGGTPLATAASASLAPPALPNPGVGQDDDRLTEATTLASTLTPVPPVSFRTVMTPQRIFWLFIIGLVVFTVTYGVQVVIWYRVKR